MSDKAIIEKIKDTSNKLDIHNGSLLQYKLEKDSGRKDAMDMTLDECITYAIEGKAILFIGSGFNYDVINYNDRAFPLGDELCKRLIDDGKIDVSEDLDADKKDLQYISEKFLDNNSRTDLVNFLKKEFSCKTLSEAQKIVAKIDWKKIYTTNYDDTFEYASKMVEKYRESVSPKTSMQSSALKRGSIIHLNGDVNSLVEKDLDDVFKLLHTSYQKRTIPESDLAICLSNDIKNSQCMIVIGYSLDYDIELQQIFVESGINKEKCLFITYNPSNRQKRNMERFGLVESIGIQEFARRLNEYEESYTPEKYDYKLQCLKKIENEGINPFLSISDDAINNLFLYGKLDMRGLLSVCSKEYVIERTLCYEIVDNITNDCQAVIIHSDMGNGKSIIVRQLEVNLSKKGDVYYLREINSFLQEDIAEILKVGGKKYIVIENYNRIIDSEFIGIIENAVKSGIRFIFTIRTYLNDNLYSRFVYKTQLQEDKIVIYDINHLDKRECTDICKILTKYSLWGTKSSEKNAKKLRYIRKTCRGEMKNIMIGVLNSPIMKEKINKLLCTIFNSKDAKDIVLLSFICEVIACSLTLQDIVLLLNKQGRIGSIVKNEQLREFIDFDNNKILLKSSIMASYVLQNMNYNDEVEKIIKKILVSLGNNTYIRRYEHMIRMLISYSNLRMLFNKKEDKTYNQRILRIYEVGKTLEYHKENPFFWLQYAIARMEQKQYDTARIYLDNAEGYRKKNSDDDSWQIDTIKGRFLLEDTISGRKIDCAFVNFDLAFHCLHDNKTPDMNYPLRQVSLFEPYYKMFYEYFTQEERNIFLQHCIDMEKVFSDYLDSPRQNVNKNVELRKTLQKLVYIREDIVNKSE